VRVLFVPTYQEPRPRPGSSSDSIGYGITSSGALVHELCRLGCEVRVLTTDTDAPDCRETFAARVAAAVPSAVHTFRPDVIFLFHSFATPASLIRLALLDAKEPHADHRLPARKPLGPHRYLPQRGLPRTEVAGPGEPDGTDRQSADARQSAGRRSQGIPHVRVPPHSRLHRPGFPLSGDERASMSCLGLAADPFFLPPRRTGRLRPSRPP